MPSKEKLPVTLERSFHLGPATTTKDTNLVPIRFLPSLDLRQTNIHPLENKVGWSARCYNTTTAPTAVSLHCVQILRMKAVGSCGYLRRKNTIYLDPKTHFPWIETVIVKLPFWGDELLA